MANNKLFLFMLAASFACNSAEYVGKLGKTDITASFSADQYTASYMYNSFRTPISLVRSSTSLDLELIYIEKNGQKEVATFKLTKTNDGLNGFWIDQKNGKKLPVKLRAQEDPRGELQTASLKNHYFRIHCNDDAKTISIIDKKTDKEVDQISARRFAQSMCLHNDLNVGDYNFDGFEDFSVFGEAYSGPNTTSLYFLYDPDSKKFTYSKQLSLISLAFDPATKTIISTNQSGPSITVDTYKWQSFLQQVDGECKKLNEDGSEYIIRPRSECL
ncbi:MAG: XAC2610-related protein [Enterovibrio sp.]